MRLRLASRPAALVRRLLVLPLCLRAGGAIRPPSSAFHPSRRAAHRRRSSVGDMRVGFLGAAVVAPIAGLTASSSSSSVGGGARPSAGAAATCAASAASASAASASAASGDVAASDNPLLRDWSSEPFRLPPFRDIKPSHFRPAFDAAMSEHISDLRSIADDPDPPTFDNVMVPLDRAGEAYGRVSSVYSNLCSSLNTDELREVQTEMTPILSRHRSATFTVPGLFDRVRAVYEGRNDAGLTDEQIRLAERIHLDFTRAGAHFDEADREEYADLKARIAALCTEFQQNVMRDEEAYEMVLGREDMAGCPEPLVQAARRAAEERDRAEEDEHVVTLSRSLVEPFLTYADRRDLREEAFRAWTRRGELWPEERDNVEIAERILKLRRRQAEMHGHRTFAEYQCADTMAKTPEAVMKLLEDVWERAKKSADREREALEEYVRESGDELDGGIQPWDWRYYAEKVRQARYDFDESALKPYLSLDAVTDAIMGVSNRLFGLRYERRPEIQTYHPDVETYEVRETLPDGTDRLVAIFLHDNYARKFKAGGAWMSELRSQTRNLPPGSDPMDGVPVVTNNNNFARGSEGGSPTLLSFDDASTLFHEMGHGHHGMLSDATYGRLSSTSVLRDFVELPSQLMERWLERPEVLKRYARRYDTGEPLPDGLYERLMAARNFNQGFATVEYTACALLDMAMHMREDYDDFNMADFERTELERLGMPQGIVMRHRPAHFQHLFSGGYYAACYYVYLWAEVLDADAFGAFEEAGDVFDPDVAAAARRYVYSAGDTAAPDELFRRFRGRDPDVRFMLEKKGLLVDSA